MGIAAMHDTQDNAVLPGLAFDAARGALTFRDVRYLIVRPETLHGFYAAARAQLGDALIGDVLYAGGFAGGRASAQKFAGDSPEATVDFMCRMGRDIGWGALRRVAFDAQARTLTLVADCSPFAEAARAAGDTAAPVCHLLRGVVGGLLSAVCAANAGLATHEVAELLAEVSETQCLAQGASCCRFEGRLVPRSEVATAPPLRTKFAVLAEIARAQHFAWREAVSETMPAERVGALVCRMWELTARDTARAYLKRLDPGAPLAPQLAACFVWSSVCMGEDARVEPGGDSHECQVVHRDCPWHRWHAARGLGAEDRAGCDAWFQGVVAAVAAATGAQLSIETLATLPDGDATCVRRITESEA